MNLKNEIPVDWLVCPETKTKLNGSGENLVSANGNVYSKNKESGYWNFIPSELKLFDKTRWESWNTLQDNATIPYSQLPETNLGVGPRKDYIEFGNFCEFRGVVLDIGVGPQKMPTHIQYSDKVFTFIGVDPLIGEQPRDFNFIQALGEYLPFKDGFIDQVVFATSLDHFIDPVVALQEAKRVLKDDGEICIWIGEKDKNTPKLKESPEWYKKLEIPIGAEDPFHFKRFNVDDLLGYFVKAGLKISVQKKTEVDQWRSNFFFKVVRG